MGSAPGGPKGIERDEDDAALDLDSLALVVVLVWDVDGGSERALERLS